MQLKKTFENECNNDTRNTVKLFLTHIPLSRKGTFLNHYRDFIATILKPTVTFWNSFNKNSLIVDESEIRLMKVGSYK